MKLAAVNKKTKILNLIVMNCYFEISLSSHRLTLIVTAAHLYLVHIVVG